MDPVAPPMLRAFGGVAAVGPDGAIDLGGPKQRAVLALLIADVETPVPLDRIVDRVWGDAPPARAEVSVRGYVSNLRKALGGAGFDAETVIEFHDGGYVLRVPASAVDLHRFDALLEDADRLERLGDLPGARAHLVAALDLYAGPAFGGMADELDLAYLRTRYEERRGDAVEALAAVRLTLGEHAQLPADLATEITRQPYRERLRAQLALALYRAGRPVEALRSIDEARRLLAEDVGVDPGPELRDLERAILAHDDAVLAWLPPPAADVVSAPDTTSPVHEETQFGRATETARATAMLDQLPRRGGVLIVAGEAGIGKSTLLASVRRNAEARGVEVGWDRCPESAAAAPYRSWRSAVHGLHPSEATLSFDPGPEEEAAGVRLALQLRELDRLRSRAAPAVVIIDDLQWADDATLSLLGLLAPELEHLRILLAVGVRRRGAEELAPGVRDCLVELARTPDPLQLTLQGLTKADLAAWVAAHTGAPAEPDLVDHLLDITGGNPFFVRELLALLDADDGLAGAFDERLGRSLVPAAVQDAVRRRTSRLPPDAQAILTVAAAIGRRFDLDLLASVLDLDLATALDRLEPALDDGLVEADDAVGRFAFSHALVSSTLAAEPNAARRAAHHARVTEAIETLHGDDLDAWLDELAHHSAEGVLAGTAPKALAYALRAAATADAAQSPADAVVQLERALAAAAMLPGFPPVQRRELLLRLGIAQRDTGDPAGRMNLVEAARLAEAQDDPEALAGILGSLDTESLWAGYDWNLYDQSVVAHVERALGRPGLSARAEVLLTMALAGELVYLDPDRSAALFARAHQGAAELADPVLTARTLIQWFWSVSGSTGTETRASIGADLSAMADAGLLPDRLRPLAHLARVSAAIEVGDADLARASIERARALAHPVRTPTGWAHLQYAEAGLALVDGDLARARGHAAALRPALQRVRRYTAETSPAVVLATIETEAGRHDEALEHLVAFDVTPYAGPIHWMRAWVLSEAGRTDEARVELAAFDDALPDDWLRVLLTTAGVLAAARLGDERHLRRHLPELEPVADHFAVLGEGGPVLGPVGYAVAAGLVALGEPDAARPHAEQARAVAERMGAVLWLRRIDALVADLPFG